MTQCGSVRAQRPRRGVPEPGKGGKDGSQHPPTESICGPNFGCESRPGPATDVREHMDAVRTCKGEIERMLGAGQRDRYNRSLSVRQILIPDCVSS